MKNLKIIFLLNLAWFFTNCTTTKIEKGFQVSSTTDKAEKVQIDGLISDSLTLITQPSNVLLTSHSNIRLLTIYKQNLNKKDNSTYIGTNKYHYRYEESENIKGNNWNNNIIPGLSAVYCFNMVNISHYNIKENKQKNFFEKPVLVKTLYYPSFTKDTLNNKSITRSYFIISVYNDDTNKDGFINQNDLRKLYLFNLNGEKQKNLVPENYSVFKSEYDSENDFMYVFAQLDINNNGQRDQGEPIHVYWIDLNDPNKTGRQY